MAKAIHERRRQQQQQWMAAEEQHLVDGVRQQSTGSAFEERFRGE